MDKQIMNSYLSSIGELVLDENKIVTYKSLSKSLNVHVNTAKQLLYEFLTQQKNRKDCSVSATYLLAGKLKDSGICITIVNEIEKAREISKFTEITSDHVYSVQKNTILNDLNVLYGLHNCGNYTSKGPCVIQSPSTVVKSKSKEKSGFQVSENKSDKDNQSELQVPAPTITNNVSSISNTKSASQTPKKQSPLGCYNKQEKKSNKNVKPTKDIASMFANAVKKSSQKPPVSSGNESVLLDQKNIQQPQQNESKSEKPQKNKSKEKEKKKEGIKRKRILIMSDSDDSTGSFNEEEPCYEDETLPEKVIKLLDINDPKDEEMAMEVEEKPGNKRKKRKIVDVTVMNEDGYLETRKEVTFTTDSEDEGTPIRAPTPARPSNLSQEKKKSKVENKKEVIASNAPKKQSSLLNFFKKN